MWICLPGVDKAGALIIADRIREGADKNLVLDLKIASSPEDGQFVERILPLV
jgi:hypothetical protein